MPYSSENADPLLSVIARIKRNPRRAILLTGIVLFVLMGMFPPWKETFQASGAFSENPKGYAFIAAPPKVAERAGTGNAHQHVAIDRPMGDAGGRHGSGLLSIEARSALELKIRAGKSA